MCRYFIIIIFLFQAFSVFAQNSDTSEAKPTIFIYNFDDSPLAMDVGFGIGVDNTGLRLGLIANLDVYHILAGFQYNVSIIFKEQLTEKAFLLGYRFRNKNIMVAFASGFGRQKFKCTSGMNADCYGYEEETINAAPLNLQVDWIITDSFALGMNINQLFSPRKDVFGVMIGLKFGAFRNIY
jgi:hypothetical protein